MFENIWSIFSAFIVFFLGIIILSSFNKYFNTTKNRILLIYIWHTLFCFAYFIYAQTYGADALMYYNRALIGDLNFKLGTSAVVFLTGFLVQGLNFGIVACFLLFNILGTVGLIFFDDALKQATQHKSKFFKRLATLIIFLPSVSFWSSAIGKDAISFMAMGLALWAALNLNKRLLLMVIAITLMLMVRP